MYWKMMNYLSAKYYQKNKDKLKNACERYQNLSEEEKENKKQYGRQNLP